METAVAIAELARHEAGPSLAMRKTRIAPSKFQVGHKVFLLTHPGGTCVGTDFWALSSNCSAVVSRDSFVFETVKVSRARGRLHRYPDDDRWVDEMMAERQTMTVSDDRLMKLKYQVGE